MKRSAGLDFLRGSAAFAVAIPHWLMADAPFQPATEAIAIAGVEVFFVLSGFVLAPQILDFVVGKPWANLGVFLARRWMRTIPPYVVALVAVALLTGKLFTADFLRYLFYVQNLFYPANSNDFFPVAWSLSVEEWFYVLFAPLMFLLGRALGRAGRRMEVAFALLVIVAIGAARLLFAPHDWDLELRRVTAFRIDSIVWGFLLYLMIERAPLASRDAQRRDRWTNGNVGWPLALAAGASALEFWIAVQAARGSAAAQAAFPYGSALFGMAWVAFFREAEPVFARPRLAAFSFTIGRVSYSAYLFHLLLIMALKPRIGIWPLPAQLALYLASVLAFSLLFWRGFEQPVLAARPIYGARLALAPALSQRERGFDQCSQRTGRRGLFGLRPNLVALALALAAGGAAILARNAFMANSPWLFYPSLLATALFALALAGWTGRAETLARAFLIFALTLPLADALYRSSTHLPQAGSVAAPTYSYRDAHQNPAAFAVWWFYYLKEWIRPDGIRGAIEAPDPQKKLPFVLVPGAAARMFDTTIRINHAGFRGPEIAMAKGDRFRIFALGESQTFGPTLHDDEKPWPEQLQDLFDQARCSRPVEVVNAGTEAYTLKDNLERMRRDILPLKPDLILSTHGMNGLLALGLRQVAEPNEPGVRPRASALLAQAALRVERALHDWRAKAAPPPAPPPLSDEALLKTPYAAAYRNLVALARAGDVPVVLATAPMAVNEESPREVKDFYGTVFKPIDDILAANAAHNRLVKLMGREEDVSVIDATKNLDGKWDDDLYLDIVHFTESGHARMARNMFEGLAPLLAKAGVGCEIR